MPTSKKPSFVGGHEKVPGLFVAAPKFPPETPWAQRHVSVVTSETRAAQIRDNDGFNAKEDEASACLSDSALMGQGDDGDAEAHEWTPALAEQVNLWPASKSNESAGVGAVHSEKLVRANGHVKLESIDAWIDPSTHGVRLIGRATLSLVKVASAIGGVVVYAGRDERAEVTRYVQFVVVRPATQATARLGPMQAMRQDGISAHDGGCAYVRMPLAVSSNDGDTAVIVAPVELPSRRIPSNEAPTTDESAHDAKRGDAANATSMASSVAKSIKRRLAKRPASQLSPLSPVPPVERDVRSREMQIHLGVSRSAQDQEPQLSVSFGWSGREKVQRVFDEPSAPPTATSEDTD